jgi:excisionase family DNA binding protein
MTNKSTTPAVFLSPQEFADKIGVPLLTVRDWIEARRVPFAQPGGKGGRILIPVTLVDDLLATAREHLSIPGGAQ